MVEPGDIFLNVKKPFDWTHTGIVIGIEDGWIQTIEGNGICGEDARVGGRTGFAGRGWKLRAATGIANTKHVVDTRAGEHDVELCVAVGALLIREEVRVEVDLHTNAGDGHCRGSGTAGQIDGMTLHHRRPAKRQIEDPTVTIA